MPFGVFRFGNPRLSSLAQLFKEDLEKGSGFALQDSTGVGVGVVEAVVGWKVVERTGSASFGI
jgi:hypothetical protein